MGNVSMIDGHIDEPRRTDNEIIKALEICGDCGHCTECPFDDLGGIDKCMHTLILNALDLINRQKAEIESLTEKLEAMGDPLQDAQYKIAEQKAEIERLTVNMNAFGRGMQIEAEKVETAKAEAIKEVTAELYNSFRQYETYDKHSTFEILDRIESVEEFLLNNIKKEMVGDAE